MKPKFHPFKQIWAGWQKMSVRRMGLSIGSGSLILIGLASGKLFHAGTVYQVSMIAATLIAGWDIAIRALRSLRNRHAS
ncbi:MAG: hypothetical protein ACM3PY_19485, partial [Omnitrophica WOR_2 bacterium]